MEPELIIIGIGSPFGADRLGWRVIELLAEGEYAQLARDARVQLLCSDRPGASLLHALQPFSRALLVDAIIAERPAGTIVVCDGQRLEEADEPLSSHGFGVAESLHLGRALNSLPAQLIIVGMVVEREAAEVPDAQLQALVQAVYRQGCALLGEHP